jgi:hypothetical protein
MKKLIGGLLVVGGVVAAVRKKGDKVADLAPEPVKQAASQVADKAGDVVAQAKDAAPDAVKDRLPGGNGDQPAGEETRRYAAPAEAGSQPPKDTGEAPSDDPQATVARTVASDPADSLHTKAHDLPEDVVMPDVSDDDPTVRAAEAAAAADAGAIGGNVDQIATDEPGFPEDPERRPVIEGSGDPDEQTLEERDAELGGNRQTEP